MSDKTEINTSAIAAMAVRTDKTVTKLEALEISVGALRDELLIEINLIDQKLHDSLETLDVIGLEELRLQITKSLAETLEIYPEYLNEKDTLIKEIAAELRVGLDEQVCEILSQIRLEALRQTEALNGRITAIENQNKAEINNTIKNVLVDHLKAGSLIDIARGGRPNRFIKKRFEAVE